MVVMLKEEIELTDAEKEKFNKIITLENKRRNKNLLIGFILTAFLLFILIWQYSAETKECRNLIEEYNKDPAGFCASRIKTTDSFGTDLSKFNVPIDNNLK